MTHLRYPLVSTRSFLTVLFFAALLVAPRVHADTVQYNNTVTTSVPGLCSITIVYSVLYGADAVNTATGASVCNASIPVGTHVRFAFKPHVIEDVWWVITGAVWDTPYGSWSENVTQIASRPSCGISNASYDWAGMFDGAIVRIKPPAKTVYNIGGMFTCGGAGPDGSVDCVASAGGSSVALFSFASTYGDVMVPTVDSDNPILDPFGIPVSAQSISCPVQVFAPPPVLSCSITFDTNPIKRGESTVIRWSSDKASLFYINGLGYVAGSGSARVSPGSATDYSGYVNDKADGTGKSVSCPASLAVTSSSGSINACPPEKILVSGKCADRCPPSFTYRNGKCVSIGCPLGYIRQGDKCIFSACPAGYYKEGDKCVRNKQCTTPPHCEGNDLVNSCTGDTISTCDYGCAGGACKPVPAPSGTLNASPKLLKVGKTTSISWSATNVRACTVTGTNGDSWAGTSSSGKTSKPIQSQTTYFLHCDGYSGSSPASIDKNVIVSIIPGWNEQ